MTKDIEEPKKRPPNKWQLFLHDCRPRQDKSLAMVEKVSACGVQYRELKEKDPKKLDEIIDNVRKVRMEQRDGE